jgi:hypothetical protein
MGRESVLKDADVTEFGALYWNGAAEENQEYL